MIAFGRCLDGDGSRRSSLEVFHGVADECSAVGVEGVDKGFYLSYTRMHFSDVYRRIVGLEGLRSRTLFRLIASFRLA